MKRSLQALTGALLLCTGMASPFSASALEPDADVAFEVIDLSNVRVRFQVKVFGLAPVVGRFERLDGTLVSSRDGRSARVSMRIEAGSVNTREEWRDDYLSGPMFFEAKRYPHITFSGFCFTQANGGSKQLVGLLSLRGTTRQVAFDVERAGTDPEDGTATYRAKTVIRRSEFGLDSLKYIVSDEVEVIVAMRTN